MLIRFGRSGSDLELANLQDRKLFTVDEQELLPDGDFLARGCFTPFGGAAQAERAVVFLHGMAGWGNSGPLDYFNGVGDALTAAGETEIFFTEVSP